MKLTTKQLKQIIKEELQSLLNESDEMQQMAQLISGEDIASVKQGLNQIILTGMTDMFGIRLVDIIDDPAASYHLKALKGWIEEVAFLYKKYHSKSLDPTKFSPHDIEEYAEIAKEVIEQFWFRLPFISLMYGYSEPSFFSKDIYDTTNTWATSFSGDVLLRIGDGDEIFGSDYYGHPARTPKPGENAFATAYNSTGEWLAKIMPMMEQNEILSQLLEELT
jgi:hypothetical protein